MGEMGQARWWVRGGMWLSLVSCQAGGPASSPWLGPGNVLVVVLDDVGPDWVGAFDGDAPAVRTPQLDQLAAEGVRFSRAYAQPICSPTRASLLTGRHPRRHGIGVAIGAATDVSLPLSEVTLPELLDAHATVSYAHAAVGKWHLASAGGGAETHPNDSGFQRYVGGLYNLAAELDDGTVETYRRWLRTVDGETAESESYVTSQTVDDALAELADMPSPWFVMVSFHAAHTPLHVPPDDLHTFADVRTNSGKVAKFGAMVEAIDTELGRLLAGIPAAERDRTTVFVMGDNGTPDHAVRDASYDAERAKGSVFEGGIRVPLTVWGYGVDRPGRVVDGLVSVVDMFPTLAEAAGIDAREVSEVPLDGVSFWPTVIDADVPSSRRIGFAEKFDLEETGALSRHSRAVFDGTYKLVRKASREDAFYRLDAELRDGQDLAQETLSDEDAAALEALQRWLDGYEAAVPVSRGALLR